MPIIIIKALVPIKKNIIKLHWLDIPASKMFFGSTVCVIIKVDNVSTTHLFQSLPTAKTKQ